MNSVICVFFLLFSCTAWCVDNCSQPKPVVYFGNGMFNDRKEAIRSAKRLEIFLSEYKMQLLVLNPDSIQISYNTNEEILTQLLQVIEQKAVSELEHFFNSLANTSSASTNFQQLFSQFNQAIDVTEMIRDTDLEKHVESYRETLIDRQLPVLIVAHSQGNMYANLAYSLLQKQIALKGKVMIESVATPSSFVAGDGNYTTLTSDRVIVPIPRSLPANVSNTTSGPFDHEFVKNYLYGDNSGPQIARQIKASLIKYDPDFGKNAKDAMDGDPGYYNADLQKSWQTLQQKIEQEQSLNSSECILYRTFIWFGQGYGGYTCQQRNSALFKSKLRECITTLKKQGFDAGWGSEGCYYSTRTIIGMDEDPKFQIDLPDECQDKLYKHSKEEVIGDFNTAIDLVDSYNR